jgi:hypothetical protein
MRVRRGGGDGIDEEEGPIKTRERPSTHIKHVELVQLVQARCALAALQIVLDAVCVDTFGQVEVEIGVLSVSGWTAMKGRSERGLVTSKRG